MTTTTTVAGDDERSRMHRDASSSSSRRRPSRRSKSKPGPRPTVCAPCHAAKVRCDRKRPCGHCVRRKVECIFDEKEAEGADDSSYSSRVKRDGSRKDEDWWHHTSTSSSESIVDEQSDDEQSDDAKQLGAMISRPSMEYACKTWFDTLLSRLGTDPYAARRRIQSLLKSANQFVYNMHRFELTNPDFLHAMIRQPERPGAFNKAMIFALAAIGVRMEEQSQLSSTRKTSDSSMWKIFPRDVLSDPHEQLDPSSLSVELQQIAETYMAQAMTSMSCHSIETMLHFAQACAYLKILQPELSDKYLYYYNLVMSVARSPIIQACLEGDEVPIRSTRTGEPAVSTKLVLARTSSLREEAVRLKLFPFWSMIHIGSLFPNVEFPTLNLLANDLDDATVYLRWPSEANEGRVGEALEERDIELAILQVQAYQIVSNGIRAWSLPYALDYVHPTPELTRLLNDFSFAESFLEHILERFSSMSSSIVIQRFLARYIVATSHLNGVIIRRLGFMHNARFKAAVVASMDAMANGVGLEERMALAASAIEPPRKGLYAWQEPLRSPVLGAWLDLVARFTSDLESAFTSTVPVERPTTKQLDSLLLYAAATRQYSLGVRQLYILLGHPNPQDVPMVVQLDLAAKRLRHKVELGRKGTSSV